MHLKGQWTVKFSFFSSRDINSRAYYKAHHENGQKSKKILFIGSRIQTVGRIFRLSTLLSLSFQEASKVFLPLSSILQDKKRCTLFGKSGPPPFGKPFSTFRTPGFQFGKPGGSPFGKPGTPNGRLALSPIICPGVDFSRKIKH